jgi:hypothetical protein
LCRLLHAGAGELADRLGAVLIPALGDHGVELLHQIVVERNRDALHGVLSGSNLLTSSCLPCQFSQQSPPGTGWDSFITLVAAWGWGDASILTRIGRHLFDWLRCGHIRRVCSRRQILHASSSGGGST